MTVIGEGVTRCSLERRMLRINARGFSRAVIAYGVLSLEDRTSGSVVAEMDRDGESYTHLLRDDAVMLGTVYLS